MISNVPTRRLDPAELELGAREAPKAPVPGDYLRFALGAVRRRRGPAVGIFLACLSLLATYYGLATPQYRAEARILAQRQQSLPSIVRSNVAEDRPTRAAWEMIHRRDNLVELIKVAELLEAPPRQSPLARLRQAAMGSAEPGGEEDNRLEALVLLLDQRLQVDVGEVTIGIELEWPDPQQAYRIVDGALQNFLEARHVQEVTALDETIAILLGRASALRAELAQATEEAWPIAAHDATGPSGHRSPPAPPRRRHESEELVRLRSMLQSKERAIRDVEEFRRRRLAELQAQYESRRAVYTEAHPEMVSLRIDIAALTRDSPQIIALRAEEQHLREELQARLGRETTARPAAGSSAEATNVAVEQAERVREARRRYEEVMESVNRAQLELDTARSAFKHRYKVIWPVQVPSRPVSPSPVRIFGVGGFASLLLAFLAAVALDWRSGKALERWQIERGLDLPILGEIRRQR